MFLTQKSRPQAVYKEEAERQRERKQGAWWVLFFLIMCVANAMILKYHTIPNSPTLKGRPDVSEQTPEYREATREMARKKALMD